MKFTDCYGEQSCTAGRASFITGQSVYPHRPLQGRRACLTDWAPGRGPDHCRAAQAARLRHRPVRQEPPGRPEQVPADRPRLRRVLRQPLSPERRGGAGAARLPESEGLSSLSRTLRPSRRDALLGDRHRRPHRGAALGPGRQAEDRGHRPAHQEAHGDLRRRVRRPPPRTGSSASTQRASPSSAGSTPPTCTCAPTPSRRALARPAGGSRRTTTR